MGPPARYPVPASRVRVEDRIRNSRFIATLDRAESAQGARALIDEVRAEFPEATHHCHAFVAGPPGSTGAVGSSDDGEPAGTAGRPMLNVLLNSGVGDVAVVVTRYFGGVKLGTGGLVRAYTGSVQHALRVMKTATRVESVAVSVVFSYAYTDAVRRVLAHERALIVRETFGDVVQVDARVPEDRMGWVVRALMHATAGTAHVHIE